MSSHFLNGVGRHEGSFLPFFVYISDNEAGCPGRKWEGFGPQQYQSGRQGHEFCELGFAKISSSSSVTGSHSLCLGAKKDFVSYLVSRTASIIFSESLPSQPWL